MKDLILITFGSDSKIRFIDELVDHYEDTIISKAKRRPDVMLFSKSKDTIEIFFANRNSMADFAKHVCNLLYLTY